MHVTSLLPGDKESSCIPGSKWDQNVKKYWLIVLLLSYRSFELAWGLPPKNWCFLLRDRRVSILSVSILHGGSPKTYHHSSVDTMKIYFSSGSLCNLQEKMYSYPKSSCICTACALKVTTKALKVCFVGRKSQICPQNSTQSVNFWRN